MLSLLQEVESGDKIVNTRGLPEGKFTFTSHEAGDHTICLQSNYTGGWFSTPQVRMHLDIAVGEAKVDEENEREHVKDLAAKVRDLNHRLADIRREQQFQREREAEFRVLSERINSRAVWWSVVQMAVLGATCAWQLRHLRQFFESKKLCVHSLTARSHSRCRPVLTHCCAWFSLPGGSTSSAALLPLALLALLEPHLAGSTPIERMGRDTTRRAEPVKLPVLSQAIIFRCS